MPTVFVISQDWNLRALVRAELREKGVEALGMESVSVAAAAVADGTLPDLVVVDGFTPEADSAALAEWGRHRPLLFIGSATEAIPGMYASAVLLRPIQVGEIVEKVRELLQGRAV